MPLVPLNPPPARSLRRLAVMALLGGLLIGPAAAAQTSEECLACHSEAIDANKFAASPHGVFDCTVCHADISGFPHPEKIVPPDCAICHSEAVAAYQRSIHGQARAQGALQAAACADCHGDVHALVPRTEADSPVHWSKLAATCARCHANEELAQEFRIPVVRPVEAYLASVHARAVASGKHGAVCSDCHGSHEILPGWDPGSLVGRRSVAETCGTCHGEILATYRESVHGQALVRGVRDAPVCTDCHGEHRILAHTEPTSPVFAANIPGETCGRCHADTRLSERYGLPLAQVPSFQDSYHGLALRTGQVTVANCASCHGVHDIRPSTDPRSHVHPDNLPETCGTCHPGAGSFFALGPVHVLPTLTSSAALYWIRIVYLWLIGLVVGAMFLHNLLDFIRKARRPAPPPRIVPADAPERMPRLLRWQHGLVMLSFPLLVYTGFALKYPESWWAAPLVRWEAQLGLRGWLHRVAAGVLVASLVWHLVQLKLSRRLRACLREMRWAATDLRQFGAMLAYYLGGRPARPHGGKFTYIEKAEYWAFLWGMVVMSVTGFLLWFETLTLRYLPKWAADVATAIHFYEAILATLAILVWHFYWVIFDPDVYPMDTSWWHGRAPATRVAERTEPEAFSAHGGPEPSPPRDTTTAPETTGE
ncbi:MAG: cytochrome b/b6 domain-containing protein [Acidobacteria bacterium]|nr:cytochrome b/b6 domain-containing protein [Acidobacteriota bacterium]